MYIVFYFAIDRIFSVVFTFIVLLVLALVIELLGGNDMFLFYAVGAVFIFAYLIVVRL